MKGHLGFPCRICAVPSAPTNLRQVGVGTLGSSLLATLAWDAPSLIGGGPILGYRVELATDANATAWTIATETEPNIRQFTLSWCAGQGLVRVSARNRCGWGNSDQFSDWVFSSATAVTLLTSSTTLVPPCWATSVKFWCVGRGGTWPAGGSAGGLAWKTWTREPTDAWGEFVCIVRNAPQGDQNALSSVSHAGTTVIGYGSNGPDSGYYSGGDGGVNGTSGGNAFQAGLPSITYPFSGAAQYSGNYNFGGAIGGAVGTDGTGASIFQAPISPCYRHSAVNRSGLLEAVSLLGLRATEECVEEAAFGSGGINFTMSVYGGTQRVDFSAGYGGGGFDSTNPGGPGCIVVKYS